MNQLFLSLVREDKDLSLTTTIVSLYFEVKDKLDDNKDGLRKLDKSFEVAIPKLRTTLDNTSKRIASLNLNYYEQICEHKKQNLMSFLSGELSKQKKIAIQLQILKNALNMSSQFDGQMKEQLDQGNFL